MCDRVEGESSLVSHKRPRSPLTFRQDESLGGGSNGWIKQLRVLRAFRLFRLFSKMSQLKRIVTAVALSIVPTLQALVSRVGGRM